jgi:glycogen synthase
MTKIIAFLTYETPFAPGGGISAVMKYLPSHIRQACDWPIMVITPFHHNINRTQSLSERMQPLGKIQVPLDGKQVNVEILILEQEGTWIFLHPEDDRIFAGLRHPYDVGKDQEEIKNNLLRDALIFGASCVGALSIVDKSAEWVLFLQDWEAATTIFSLEKNKNDLSYRAFLTIHNTYDMHASHLDLHRLAINPNTCPGGTVLERALPFVEDPVFTVSDQFASDLLGDPLQAKVMAPHLVETLSGRLLGVDNGLFANLTIDADTLEFTRRGDFAQLDHWKAEKQRKALQTLGDYFPTPEKPLWGNPKKLRQDNLPWFVMAGRDDSRQKGYDLAYQAISSFLERNGEACFLLFPIPGDEGLNGLRFLQELAENHPENVLVLPFLFQEGYFAALQGAAFAIMPSFYEPFGMANEFYMNGAVGIGRATGGILQQIIPLRSAAAFSQAVKLRAEKYFPVGSHPTGILFRERDDLPSLVADWKEIARSNYQIDGTGLDRVRQRTSLSLFSEMAKELYISIMDGVRVYNQDPTLYNRMLIEGIDYLRRTFSWQRAAQTYLRYVNQN